MRKRRTSLPPPTRAALSRWKKDAEAATPPPGASRFPFASEGYALSLEEKKGAPGGAPLVVGLRGVFIVL